MLTATRARARRTLTAALTAALVLGSVQGAAAEPPWVPPVDLGTVASGSFDSPSVAVADDGATAIAFRMSDGTNGRIYVATRAPGGAFKPAVPVSDGGVSASSPKVAIDPQGNITVAWVTVNSTVQAAYQPAGQGWGPAQPLTAAGEGTTPYLTAGANGGAAVGWWSGANVASQRARVAVRAPGAAYFAAPLAASSITSYANAGSGVYAPRVAMDAAGTVVAIWTRYIDNPSGTVHAVVETAIKPAASAAFDAPVLRSSAVAGDAGTDPSVVITPAGKATAIWTYHDGTSTRVDYVDRPAGGSFGSTNTLTNPAPASATSAKLAGNDGGDVVVSWSQASSVHASVRPNGGAFSAPQAVGGPPASSTASAVTISDSGEALVVWPTFSTGDYSVFSARRRPDGVFGEIKEVVHGKGTAPATVYANPAVDMDDQGNGFVAVRRDISSAPTSYSTYAIGYDVVAPDVSSVTAPGAVTVGRSAAFEAGVSDRMGAPAITWSFGDGTSGSGATTSHVFNKGGTYTVTLTAVDAAGNSTSATRSVRVDPVRKIAAAGALKAAKAGGGKTRIKSLKVTRLVRGDTVRLVCKTAARGCTKAATRTVKAAGSAVAFTEWVKGLMLKPKAKLVLTITRPGTVSRTITYTMRSGKAPTRKVR